MAEDKQKYTIEQLGESLNENQIKFCHRWIIDYNNVQSYLHAYPNSSYDAACVSANELLRNPKIKKYIEFIKNDIEKEAGISKLKVIQEHAKIAFSSIAHLHDTWVSRHELEQLTDEQRECIQEIDSKIRRQVVGFGEGGEEMSVDIEHVKVKLYDKQKSLEAIAKLMGYNDPEKINHSGEISIKPKEWAK